MKIKQYVYFGLRSEVLTSDEITERLGLQPDEAQERGSRKADPPRPVQHRWNLRSDEAGLTISEHVARLIPRLEPIRASVRQLVDSGEAKATLQLVRYFGVYKAEKSGEEEEITETPEGLVKLPGQHQLLGWRLDRAALEFMAHVGAELDADEYG